MAVPPPYRPKNRACDFEGCSNPHTAFGLCGGHNQQRIRGAALTPLARRIASTTRDDQGRKNCCRCLRWLDPSSFYPSRRNSDGLSSDCNVCDKLTRYNISRDQYDAFMAAQNNGCAICGGVNSNGTALHVDHDHACCPDRKKSCGSCVRGLLCEDCNRVLGMMADDPKRLRKAADYLEGGDAQ